MATEDLILEMKAVKAGNPTLTIVEVLQLFNIQAMRDLTNTIKQITFGR